MVPQKNKYNLPVGYSLLQTTLKSTEFLNNPIQFISKSMVVFSGTYTASLGINRKLIITQDPGFIDYILKVNHRNYHKSELSTERAVQFFGNGLLFSNGDYWLKQRRLIQPAFHREKLQGLYNIIVSTIDEYVIKFPTGTNIDVYPLAHELSFHIIVRSLFDIKLSASIMEELSQVFTELQDFLIKDINQPLRKLFYPFTGSENAQLKKARRLREIFTAIINERKASTESYADLLDMLLKSKYEDTGEAMTTDQVIDEMLILIFAGHETTANTLSWLLYLLATHKEILQQLRTSLKDSTVFESLSNEYLKAVINETMRLYPAAWMTERVALEDDSFKQFSYPKNTIIIPFFFGLHNDKFFWKDAVKFQPERFINDPILAKSKHYFPFGAGPRMCIGNNFAIAEMCFFVFAFLKQFNIEATMQIPVMKPLITLRPDRVVLNIEKL
ncbi:MAG: cytochrome P450 [Rhizobacter sp.]|nr:cytochrome P450 [Ferruginibacter sp.]